MMRRWATLAVLVGSVASARWTPAASPAEFQVFSYDLNQDGGTAELPGRLFIPTGVADGEKRPLVLFFHGIGERGTDNSAQVNANINGLLEKAKEHKFYLYAPQLNSMTSEWGTSYVDMAIAKWDAARTFAG